MNAPTPVSQNGIAACTDGTVASYLGTSCSQLPSVMHWTSYSCTSTPTTICDSLGPNGANVRMRMDPDGPHTILVGSLGLWNVTAGENVDVVIHGEVYGATGNLNWPHFPGMLGQTGDGTEENVTTVLCGSNCTKLNGISDIPCSSTSPVEYCTDQPVIDAYQSQRSKFNAASSSAPYPFTIEVKLDGGISGTANLYSVGVHIN